MRPKGQDCAVGGIRSREETISFFLSYSVTHFSHEKKKGLIFFERECFNFLWRSRNVGFFSNVKMEIHIDQNLLTTQMHP